MAVRRPQNIPSAEDDNTPTHFSDEKAESAFLKKLRCGSAKFRWRSQTADVAKAYLFKRNAKLWQHYDIQIIGKFKAPIRGEPDDGFGGGLFLQPMCKTRPNQHVVAGAYYEAVSKDGTNNCLRTMARCAARYTGKTVQPSITLSFFNKIRFAACVVLHVATATSKEAFTHFDRARNPYLTLALATANDQAFLGSNDTLVRHTKAVHDAMAAEFGVFLVKRNRGLHLVLDGWTSPNSLSILGVVVIYEDGVVTHCRVLKFIHCTSRHTGRDLARILHKCCEDYVISHLIRSLVMGNCNTLAIEYKKLNTDWYGPKMRVRCFAHIIQLVMAALYSPFSMTPARVGQEKRPSTSYEPQASATPTTSDLIAEIEEDDPSNTNIAQLAERMNKAQEPLTLPASLWAMRNYLLL